MSYRFVLDKYEGPLDLLLELIDQRKLEVNEISLTAVSDQYVQYINEHDIPPEEMADFLTVAVKLLLLKTRALLPYLEPELEEEEQDLAQQLKIYQVYWQAAKRIDKLAKSSLSSFGKTKSLAIHEVIFSPPRKKKITAKILLNTFHGLVAHLEPFITLPQTSIKKTVSLGKKIFLLKELLEKAETLSLNRFLSRHSPSRTDLIVNFLAVLELIKQNEIIIRRAERDAELTLIKI